MIEIRGPYSPRKTDVVVEFDGKQKAKQSFKDDCDINIIMAKFQKTGAVTHFNKRSPEYGFATGHDFKSSMDLVKAAQEMFDELPSTIRSKFANQPAAFLDFVQDPANADEMLELGLREKLPGTRTETPPEPETAPEPPPEPPPVEPPA